jgi:biotin carboxyl carrier protein
VKYFVEVYGKSYELDVESTPDGKYVVRGEGGEHVVDYLETTPHEASLLIDGCSTTFWFSEPRGGAVLASDGRDSFELRAVDERTRLEESILGRKMAGRGASEVRSIMPGIVTRVLVKEGDLVEAGHPLLCIEAMKMENEIKAEGPGIVRKIFVAAGKTVNAGEALVDMGPA